MISDLIDDLGCHRAPERPANPLDVDPGPMTLRDMLASAALFVVLCAVARFGIPLLQVCVGVR